MHEPGRGFSGTPQVLPCRLASGILASRRPLKPRPGSCLCAHPFVWEGGIPDISVVLIEGGRRLGMGWGRFSPTVWRHGCRRRAYKDVLTACRRRPHPTHACRGPVNYRPGTSTAPFRTPFALTLTLSRKRERGLFRPTSSVRGVLPQSGQGTLRLKTFVRSNAKKASRFPDSRCGVHPWSRSTRGRGTSFPDLYGSRTVEPVVLRVSRSWWAWAASDKG